MASYRDPRNVLESTISYLETNINADWSNINIVSSFNSSYKGSLPVIAVMLPDFSIFRKEISTEEIYKNYTIRIDIYATSQALRLDLIDYIVDKLSSNWTYNEYEFDSGGATPVGTAIGELRVVDWIENIQEAHSETIQKNEIYKQSMEILVR